MARRRLTVLEWMTVVGNASDQIETVICYGSETVCKGPSPQWIASHGPVGPLEAKVNYVTLTRDRITVYAKPKDITI